MNSEDTIALCIPAYNAAWCLPTLNNSILFQNTSFNEILLYNDCSIDNTAEVASGYGYKILNGNKNKGCSHGKNELAKIASSKWLFFLDSDDELLPDFLENVYKKFDSANECDAIVLGYEIIDPRTGEIRDESNYDEDLLLKDPVRFMIRTKLQNVMLVKTDSFLKIGGFETQVDLLYTEDRAYAVKTALMGFKYNVIHEKCFRINYYPNSMSAKNPRLWLTASLKLWEKTSMNVGSVYKSEICKQLFECATWSAKYSYWDLVKQILALIKKINPNAVPKTSFLFRNIFKLSPIGAYYFREMILRINSK